MKKINYFTLFLITLLFFTNFATVMSANESEKSKVEQINLLNSNFSFLPNPRLEWCRVSLDNPRSSLNVRTYSGRVVGKVKHGTLVFVNEYEDAWARISIKQGRRLVEVGWVASEYLSC